jgi:ribosomal protein S18 acetylase RimI-like enzyme
VPALRWVPLSAELVPVWHRLLDTVTRHDDLPEWFTPEELADELDPEWVDPLRDTLLGLDETGVARAFGLVGLRNGDTSLLRVLCWGAVDPERRGRGIGRELLRWQLERAAERVAVRRAELGAEVPARATIAVEERTEDAAKLAARAGMIPLRWYFVMQRDLSAPIEEVKAPDGIDLVPWHPDLDEAVRLAHNEAFADGHWGFQPWTPESWQLWESGSRMFRPDWSWVALEGETVAGYALSAAYEEDWKARGYSEGWTNKLGVRRPWRGQGLARALLTASLHAYAASGMQYAGLDVDADNPSGAVGLYRGLGYEQRRRSTHWARDL